LRLAYTDLFDAATIARMAGHFQVLLEGIVADPERPVSALPMLGAAEAHHLRGLGVGAETLVGLCVERSLEMVVGLLGILKAGGAYLPLDPEYPEQRLAFMLEDAQVPLIVTHSALRERFLGVASVLCVDQDWAKIAEQAETSLSSGVEPENLAYVIYTSGSTGRPKGVLNSHGGILNRLIWMDEAYALQPADRVLQKTSFSFDVSVWEFLWPLMRGGGLVMA